MGAVQHAPVKKCRNVALAALSAENHRRNSFLQPCGRVCTRERCSSSAVQIMGAGSDRFYSGGREGLWPHLHELVEDGAIFAIVPVVQEDGGRARVRE